MECVRIFPMPGIKLPFLVPRGEGDGGRDVPRRFRDVLICDNGKSHGYGFCSFRPPFFPISGSNYRLRNDDGEEKFSRSKTSGGEATVVALI
ncbi:hypothetical protein NPIL_75531 [Nephila pilipes]|uniref:Uncharacterized protein n=1 Tax=Nephila pilipes TaxID=299642 RepID=A0A8X6U6A9_NEPPI|nr:hypothetical protein NPIL_75531 [Nephila pilipes]